MTRLFGMAVLVLWLIAMGSIFYCEIWPHWIAGDPPPQMPEPNSAEAARRFQNGIFGSRGRLGTSWIHFYSRGGSNLVHTQTSLEGLPHLPDVFVDSELTYEEDGKLDSIKLQIIGPDVRLEFTGENYGMDFSCSLRTGPGPNDRYGFKLDAAAAATMSDTLRPFTLLKDLYVGKTWRIRLINPLPALSGGRASFQSYLARVTDRQTIQHQGRSVPCYKIECRNLRAWANDDGQVLVQEVDLPIFGTLTIRQEPYDGDSRLTEISRKGLHGLRHIGIEPITTGRSSIKREP